MSNKKQIFNASEASKTKYYGVSPSKFNCKYNRGFIMRSAYNHGSFRLIAADDFTQCNGWSEMENIDISKLISNLLLNGWSVYEFPTYRHLLRWLSDDANQFI
jgi:hypothetical protein